MPTSKNGRRLTRVQHHPAAMDTLPAEVADANANNQLASVPDKRYATEYVSRDVMGMNDLDLLDYACANGQNVLLYGPTGPGKTSYALAWAARRQTRFYSVACNISLDPSQMFGKWGQDETGLFVWYDGGVTDIVRNGGLLLCNEINFMSDRIAPVLYEFFDKRREISLLDHKGEKIRAHRPDCWCSLPSDECEKRWVLAVADMNPDYQGTRPLNAALRNRFQIQVHWDYDPNVEAQLVQSQTLRTVAANARRLIGTRLQTPVATNMLQEFEKLAFDIGIDFAVANFCSHFTDDERPAIKGVFDSLMTELRDDFKPDESEGWNQFTGALGDDWLPQSPVGSGV